MNMKILAIGAHPDDLEIFCFGLLSACKARGDTLCLAVATDGAAGVIAGKNDGAVLAKQREVETQTALAELGMPEMLGLPDGRLATTHQAAQKIAEYITHNTPDLIITHDPQDYHPDHRALSQLVTSIAGFTCPVLYAEPLMGVGFEPEYYVDITPYFEAKEKAIMAHHSQQPEKFFQAAALMNRFRAAQCNAPDGNYAETYRLNQRFPFADIRAMLPPPPPYRPFYQQGSDGFI